MSGGIHRSPRRRCARQLATGLLGSVLVAPWSAYAVSAEDAATSAANAANAAKPAADDCEDRPREQSIVVRHRKAAPSERIVFATDQPERETLEPIANVSECEPELADPPAVDPEAPQTPTLADAPEPARGKRTATSSDAEKKPASDSIVAAKPEPLIFNGLIPGVSTREELLSQWGAPAQELAAGQALTYHLEFFPTVTVSLRDDVVDSVSVELAEPAAEADLVEKLGLAGLRPVIADDPSGDYASSIYPDRGVTLNRRLAASDIVYGTDSDDPLGQDDAVFELVVRPIEASTFILRASAHPPREFGRRMADLETALSLDRSSAEARIMLADLKLATGQAKAAEQLAAEACELSPRIDEYRLVWARCLKYLARYDEAIAQTRLVIEGDTATQLVRAQALEQMALLAALGPQDVQQRSLPLHKKAIELATQLADEGDGAVRISAEQLLVSAHLSVADQIAGGQWDGKEDAVGPWMNRASALAEDMIARGEADVSLRLQVALTGLVAGGRLSPPVDPKPWIAEAEEAAAELASGEIDELALNELNWQMGLAYYHAAEIQHRRGDADSALEYGELAEVTLEPLAEAHREFPDTDHLMARVQFQMGAVHAVHHGDHELACQWYDKAHAALQQPVPLTRLATPGRHGDALVSMGVSYWETGDHERAYDLTKAGADLVQQGVSRGLLQADALSVPQSNLTAMARALGKTTRLEAINSGAQLAQEKKPSPRRTADRRAAGGSTPTRRR